MARGLGGSGWNPAFFLTDASEILELKFITDDAGHVTELMSELSGQNMLFKRRED